MPTDETKKPKVTDETAAEPKTPAESDELAEDELDAVAGGVAVHRPIIRQDPDPVCVTKLTQ